MDKRKQALLTAIEQAGGQSALGRALTCRLAKHPVPLLRGRRISQPQIAVWVRRDQKAPSDMCGLIESVTGVTREQLRPDVFYR